MDEIATGRITGEEDRFAHTDLVTEMDERFADIQAVLEQYREGDGRLPHDQLTQERREGLSGSSTALTGSVSGIATSVAGR
jgi:iron uptake system component EfeO